jgi:hypothetical protein
MGSCCRSWPSSLAGIDGTSSPLINVVAKKLTPDHSGLLFPTTVIVENNYSFNIQLFCKEIECKRYIYIKNEA